MKLNKTLMCSALVLGLLAGVSEGHATLNAYEQHLKFSILEKGIVLDDLDVKVFAVMLPKFVKPLLDTWKEAKVAGMSHAVIRAIIGTNKNQAAVDALSKEIANRKAGGNNSSNSTNSTNSNAGGNKTNNTNGTNTNSNAGTNTSTNSTNSNADDGTSTPKDPAVEKKMKDTLEEFMLKNMGKTTFKDRPKFVEYIMSNSQDVKGVTKLINDVYSFMLDELEPEQYVMLKKENFPMEVVRAVAKLKPDYEALIKSHKAGKNPDQLIAEAKAQNNSNSTEYTDVTFANGIGLVIDKDKYGKKTDFFMNQPYYKDLRNELNKLDAQGQAAFIAQMKADVDKFRVMGASDFEICELMLESGINVMAFDAYVTNPGKTFSDFYKDATSMNYKVRAKAVFGLPSNVDDSKAKVSYYKLIRKLAPDKWENNIPLKQYYSIFAKAANSAYDTFTEKNKNYTTTN